MQEQVQKVKDNHFSTRFTLLLFAYVRATDRTRASRIRDKHPMLRLGNWCVLLSYSPEIGSPNEPDHLARLTGEGDLGICLLLFSMLLLQAHTDMSIAVDAENSNANPHLYSKCCDPLINCSRTTF